MSRCNWGHLGSIFRENKERCHKEDTDLDKDWDTEAFGSVTLILASLAFPTDMILKQKPVIGSVGCCGSSRSLGEIAAVRMRTDPD